MAGNRFRKIGAAINAFGIKDDNVAENKEQQGQPPSMMDREPASVPQNMGEEAPNAQDVAAGTNMDPMVAAMRARELRQQQALEANQPQQAHSMDRAPASVPQDPSLLEALKQKLANPGYDANSMKADNDLNEAARAKLNAYKKMMGM